MKIVTIIGARPQFIKAAALCHTMAKQKNLEIEEIRLHTGQHYDQNMSDTFFQELDIPHPQYNLGIHGGSHAAMTGQMLVGIEKVLMHEKPAWVLVYGDTNSTLAGALAAAKLHIRVAHVEAGLRSFNRKMPEEINRILTDQCADLLFTPTNQASERLLREGVPSHKIIVSGDIMYDAALFYRDRAKGTSQILKQLQLTPKNYFLATVHRAENTDDPVRLQEIFLGLKALSKIMRVIIPLHPRTKLALEKAQLLSLCDKNFTAIAPLGYLDMIQLEAHAKTILTDSGGVQKEAYFFHVPCLTLREETEWTELLTHGCNRLVKAQRETIVSAASQVLSEQFSWPKSLYGNGDAGKIILEALYANR